ncbi:MAG: MoxR family ATPase [Planctomycetes bacterium]|nr:MoxR family ATPase [Planctomycetota bacterium]
MNDIQTAAKPGANHSPPSSEDVAVIARLREARDRVKQEMAKVVVGQHEIIDSLLIGLLCRGHVLMLGVPGLGKTLMARTLARTLDMEFRRVQFTPDLMPADITGTDVMEEDHSTGKHRVSFMQGPVFTNFLLADEINRTPPKTQAALLQAMQEGEVSVGRETYLLKPPFYVVATQNPIEMEGTYPLPEAQLDRFMFNVVIDYLPEDDEVEVVVRTTAAPGPPIEPIFTGEDVLRFHDVVRKVPVAEDVVRYAVRLASASRPHRPESPDFVNHLVSWGAGLRAAQYLVLGGKARALLAGRAHVAPQDVQALAAPVLRHRILVSYRAEAEGASVEDVIARLLEHVKPA